MVCSSSKRSSVFTVISIQLRVKSMACNAFTFDSFPCGVFVFALTYCLYYLDGVYDGSIRQGFRSSGVFFDSGIVVEWNIEMVGNQRIFVVTLCWCWVVLSGECGVRMAKTSSIVFRFTSDVNGNKEKGMTLAFQSLTSNIHVAILSPVYDRFELTVWNQEKKLILFTPYLFSCL